MNRIPANISALRDEALTFRSWLNAKKLEVAPAGFWYPYDILANFTHLEALLSGEHRKFFDKITGVRIADIGAADGDNGFFLESYGNSVDIIDNGPTNFNGLRGAHRLKEALGSAASIHSVDMDLQFSLPHSDYRLALLLGILYHLKNPYYTLEHLATRAEYCLLSTKIARFSSDRTTEIRNVPLTYLLDAGEANNDPTNYWIFSETSLKRIIKRTGWRILNFITVGDTVSSDPVDNAHDERAFCLLRSDRFGGK